MITGPGLPGTDATTSDRRHGNIRIAMCIGVLVAALAFAGAPSAWGQESGEVPDLPQVEGPVTGPGEMFVGLRPGPEGTNPDDFDYVTEEYFVSGTAGPADNPYEVRVAVRRPADAERFSGTVVAEATHFTGNALVCNYARYGIFQRGHVCVDVMARSVNLENTLRPFNSQRYGDLVVDDAQTLEILAQVGHLLQSNDVRSPLSPAEVDKVVLVGTSDSSNPARAYMAGTNESFRMADGGPIFDALFVHATLGGDPVVVPDVPTIQMPTQTEVHSTDSYRQPDGDEPGERFRLYEVAGMSHSDSRENPQTSTYGCDNEEFSQFPFGALVFLGLQHAIDWPDGQRPPRAARIEVDELGDTRVALDEFGNAKGGVRSTYLDVPTHRHVIPNSPGFLCSLTGYQVPLPSSDIDDLYQDPGEYTSAVINRLTQLVWAGWFPIEYVDDYVLADMQRFVADYWGRTALTGEQDVTATVPDDPDSGEFLWSISGDGNVDLGDMADEGTHLRATGPIDPILVTDTRTGGPAWSISGQVSGFDPGGLGGNHLGWTPRVLVEGAGATAGDAVASGIDGGDGLSVAQTMASAEAGHGLGTGRVGADLDLRFPAETDPGQYTATLTITALS